MHVPGQRGGAAIAADFGRRESVSLIIGAEAAMLLRNRDAEQTTTVHISVVFSRKDRITIVGGCASSKYRLPQFSRAPDDHSLFVIEAESRGIENRCVESDIS